MPRRNYRRRFKRRRYNGRRKSFYQMQKQLKAIGSNQELKFHDTEDQVIDFAVHTGAWTSISLLNLIQGATSNTRIGDKIKVKRFTLRGNCSNNQNTPVDAMMRLVIFRSKEPHNVAQTVNMIMSDPNNINTLRYMPHKHRFKVYFDQTWTMKASTDTSSQVYLPIKINIPLNFTCEYNGNVGDATDIERNGLYMILCGTSANPNEPRLNYNCRFTYYDS